VGKPHWRSGNGATEGSTSTQESLRPRSSRCTSAVMADSVGANSQSLQRLRNGKGQVIEKGILSLGAEF
jgi:hypothetical protein